MSAFAIASLVGWVLVVAVAARFRSRAYAIFRAISLGLHSLIVLGLLAAVERLIWVFPVFVALHGLVHIHAVALVRPRLRPLAYRALVSIPAAFFGAGTLLAWPWALAHAFGFELWGWFLPYALALVGVVQSLGARVEEVELVVADGQSVPKLARHARAALDGVRVARPLRLVQITDPHLGPFMSVARLRRIAERAVRRNPDLVVLTGDFLTMESQSDPKLLADALAPLAALEGRVFACFGNHDHEAPLVVRHALERIGARLLIDEAALVQTPAGRVQVLGVDFVFRERAAHVARVFAEHPREPRALRLVLLHDPGAFRHVPEGDADLVLSGHTHGGQIGLVSLGLPWTLLRAFVSAPDHGLWARGPDRLYVHRGTGHYGFPLRLGVPAEESLLLVHAPSLQGEA